MTQEMIQKKIVIEFLQDRIAAFNTVIDSGCHDIEHTVYLRGCRTQCIMMIEFIKDNKEC
jgi:hypothetical protein